MDHFVSEAEKFVHTIIDSANGQASGIDLAKPQASYVENFQPGQQSLEKIARNNELVNHCEEVICYSMLYVLVYFTLNNCRLLPSLK